MVYQKSRDRSRALRRAAVAWNAGKPHTAWEILATTGHGDLWPEFQRTALRRARTRFRTQMRLGT